MTRDIEDFDPNSVNAKTMRGDARDCVLNLVRNLDKPWQQLSEAEQTERANQIDTWALEFVEHCVKLVRAEDTRSVEATVEAFNIKGGTIDVKLKATNTDDALLALNHMRKENVLLLSASARPYQDAGTSAMDHVQPDQPDMLPAPGGVEEEPPQTQAEQPEEAPEEPPQPEEAAAEQEEVEAAEEAQDDLPKDDLEPSENGTPLYSLSGQELKRFEKAAPAYWAGVEAYKGGAALDDNPGKLSSNDGKMWKAGWQHAAKQESEAQADGGDQEPAEAEAADDATEANPDQDGEGEAPLSDDEAEALGRTGEGYSGVEGDPGGEMPGFLKRGQDAHPADDDGLTDAL